MTTVRWDDNRGGMRYPFLPDEWRWEIYATTFDQLDQAPAAPTLRWVKDDKVLDLVVVGMDSEQFFTKTGLVPSLKKGGYIFSKRLSRVLRPYRFWGFYAPDEVRIVHDPGLNAALWDGCGRVSRAFLPRLLASLTDLPPHEARRFKRELLTSGRFEVTILHEGGEEKGDVLVVDSLPGGADFMFPAGSAKKELSLTGRVFVGLAPRHAQDSMRLDVQSLVNLHPFFAPGQLLAWVEMESELFLERIRSGEIEALLGRLYGIQTPEELDRLASWHVGEYLASGGRVMHFASMVRVVAKQHLERLEGSIAQKLRYPIPGGRYYIFPAAIGERDVPRGHIELDHACATAWVNSDDWLESIVRLLGGCDGDDALWVFPFTDEADGERKIIVWRSPNQLGEYVILRPTERSHEIKWATPGGQFIVWTTMNSRLLPPRVDSVRYQYTELEACAAHQPTEQMYTIAAMQSSIQIAATNEGTLGGYCNALLITKALYGRLPEKLPATLEDVIDGSVKTGLNLTPVKEWVRAAASAIVRQGKRVPECLVERIAPLLSKQERGHVQISDGGHWLDVLAAGMVAHQAAYVEQVEVLAAEAVPPIEVFDHGRDWLPVGRQLRQVYASAIRTTGSHAAAREASEGFLCQWPAQVWPDILLAACAVCYAGGTREGDALSDAVVWQLGAKRTNGIREPGIAHEFLAALRAMGLIGEPVWTTEGAVLHYAPEIQPAGMPVTLNGVWYNWLRRTQPDLPERMGLVPKPVRQQAKARIATMAATQFVGMVLQVESTDDGRVITRTPHGTLFGWVQKGQETLVTRHRAWRIQWATAVDGNIHAILQPAG